MFCYVVQTANKALEQFASDNSFQRERKETEREKERKARMDMMGAMAASMKSFAKAFASGGMGSSNNNGSFDNTGSNGINGNNGNNNNMSMSGNGVSISANNVNFNCVFNFWETNKCNVNDVSAKKAINIAVYTKNVDFKECFDRWIASYEQGTLSKDNMLQHMADAAIAQIGTRGSQI